MPSSDLEIIKLIQSGKKDYYQDLYIKYVDKVYRFIYHKTGSKTQTEDIVSDSFLIGYEKISTFDTTKYESFGPRIHSVANNQMKKHFAKNNEKNLSDFAWANEVQNPDYDILAEITDKNIVSDIFKYLDTINPEYKEVFVMRVRDDIPYSEIAQTLGKSTDNCKQIFSRTIKKITEKFGHSGLYSMICLF